MTGFSVLRVKPCWKHYFWYQIDIVSERKRLLQPPPPPKVDIPPIETNDINTAAQAAEVKRKGRINLERSLKISGIVAKKRGPASVHRKLQRSSKRSKKLSKHAQKIIDTSSNLVIGYFLDSVSLKKRDWQQKAVLSLTKKFFLGYLTL